MKLKEKKKKVMEPGEKETIFPLEVILDPDLNKPSAKKNLYDSREI